MIHMNAIYYVIVALTKCNVKVEMLDTKPGIGTNADVGDRHAFLSPFSPFLHLSGHKFEKDYDI